jgi:hypothetical protein
MPPTQGKQHAMNFRLEEWREVESGKGYQSLTAENHKAVNVLGKGEVESRL